MLIPFPIASLSVAPVTDIIHVAGGSVFWADASYYLLWLGLASGALAALVGLVDFIAIRRARSHRQGWFHLGANVGVLALTAVNVLLRVDQPAAAILPAGLILSLVGLALLSVGGWYGGELAYRHEIGVVGHGSSERGPRRDQETGAIGVSPGS